MQQQERIAPRPQGRVCDIKIVYPFGGETTSQEIVPPQMQMFIFDYRRRGYHVQQTQIGYRCFGDDGFMQWEAIHHGKYYDVTHLLNFAIERPDLLPKTYSARNNND